jgi:hypothetical protein
VKNKLGRALGKRMDARMYHSLQVELHRSLHPPGVERYQTVSARLSLEQGLRYDVMLPLIELVASGIEDEE